MTCYNDNVRLAWHKGRGIFEKPSKRIAWKGESDTKKLGEKVHVSRQAINAIETGKYDPSLWLAYDIAQLFHMTIEEVFIFKESERKWNH